MKILNYKLTGFFPFSFSKIKTLELNYPEDIQVILGNNGCGKSSYLRTLTPYPLSRSMFKGKDVDGYREMTISHDGHIYTLISDYSNKTSPHQFIKDDEGNLNDGGTTNVQCELIETHLGLTKEKENLLFSNINFCSMKPGEVKPFLMKICPLDLGWILDKQKRVSSLLRNIKAELKYLVSRETQLLAEMVSEKDLETLNKQKTNLHKTITKFIGDKSSINTKIESLDNELEKLRISGKNISDKSKKELEEEIVKLERELSASSDAELIALSSAILPEDYSKHEYEKQSLEKNISDTVSKLDEIESNLKKSEGENAEELIASITSDKNRLAEIEKSCISNPLSPSDIEDIKTNLELLKGILDFISKINDGKAIWTRAHFRNKVKIYDRITSKSSNISRRMESTGKQIERLKEELNLGWSSNINPCAKSKCLLYVLATSKQNERKELLKEFELEYNKDARFVNRYKNYIKARHDDFARRSKIDEALYRLKRLASDDCPSLIRFIKRSDFLNILSSNPYAFFRDVEQTLASSDITNEANALRERISANETHLKTIDKISESYKEYLIKDKDKLNKDLEGFTVKYKSCLNICKSIKHRIELKDKEDKILTYKKSIADLEILEGEQNILINRKVSLKEQKEKVQEELTSSMTDLTNIEMTLSSQDKIQSRYKEEVKARKDDLELKLKYYTDLEFGAIELPKIHMRRWLDDLVEQVNIFINVVWNQPLELVAPKDDKDYKFTARFKGKEVENLQMCSSAMEDIINLCVCLALRSPVASADDVGMRGYPLALDETGRTFDDAHKSNLIDLFNLLVQEGLVSQIYLASHHAVIHGALTNIQTLVLNSDNIALPANYNQEVNIEYY